MPRARGPRAGLLLPCLLAAILLLPGCSLWKGKDEAAKVAQDDFDALKTEDFDHALKDYSPQFFRATSREKWIHVLRNLDAKLGSIQSYTLVNWNINAGTFGTKVALIYKVKRAKYESDESLLLTNESGTFLILGHHINSEGLLE